MMRMGGSGDNRRQKRVKPAGTGVQSDANHDGEKQVLEHKPNLRAAQRAAIPRTAIQRVALTSTGARALRRVSRLDRDRMTTLEPITLRESPTRWG